MAALSEAERLAERQRVAEDKYAEADVDGDESVSKAELSTLLQSLLHEQGLEVDDVVIAKFVDSQFEQADEDADGTVSFDEFCAYYNKLLDILSGEQREKLIAGLKEEDAALVAERKEAAAAELMASDIRDMQALMRLIGLLSHPSVAPISGTQLMIERGEADVRPDGPPSEEEMRTSCGLVLELSRYGQRLLTPWGAYPMLYTLTFEGYNEDQARAVPEEAALSHMNTESFYFLLCRISSAFLRLKKLPERTHFAITHICGVALPVGEVIGELGAEISHELALELRARYEAAVGNAELPDLSFRDEPLLINSVLGKTVVINERLLGPLESRLKKSKTKPKLETLRTALEIAHNDLDAAFHLRQEHLKAVDKLVSSRKGYSTREHCDDVLTFCKWDAEAALFVLNNEVQFEAIVSEILKRKGLASGLGFPSRDEVRWEVALARCDQAVAIRAIMRQWLIEVRMMREIVQFAPVDELLTRIPEHQRPPRAHVEKLLQTHSFDLEYVAHLLSDAAFILERADELGRPSRERVEELVVHFDFDEHKVRSYLKSVEYIFKSRRQVGSPSRAEIEHYLEKFGYDQKAAVKYMRLVYKFIDPTPPRERLVIPKKVDGRLIKHLAHDCELLLKGAITPWSRRAVEVALDATKNAEGQIVEDDAIAFLLKVSRLSKEVPQMPRWELEYAVARSYVLDRDDGKVTLDETLVQWRRFEALVVAMARYGSPDRRRVCALMEALGYDEARVEERLRALHELQTRSEALGAGLSLEQIEALLKKHEYSLPRALSFVEGMHALRSRAGELGSPPQRELEKTLLLHDLDAVRAERHLSSAFRLGSDRDFLADAGQPNAADIGRALAVLDFDYEQTKLMLLHVNQIKVEAERWGAPSREQVEAALLQHKLDKAEALAAIKEEYRRSQFDVFRAEQLERKEHEAAQRIVLVDNPAEAERLAREAREAEEAQRAAEAAALEAEEAERTRLAEEAEATRKKAEEDRRAMLMGAMSVPSAKEVVKRRSSKDAGADKDINQLNAERLERIASLEKSIERRGST